LHYYKIYFVPLVNLFRKNEILESQISFQLNKMKNAKVLLNHYWQKSEFVLYCQ